MLVDRVSPWARRDLARVHGAADVVTAPTPRAVELLGARTGLSGRAVFCMPGIAESQSLVTLEAMAVGRPVVAAGAVALPHLVHPGLLYRPGDVTGLATALTSLLDDPAIRVRMGADRREAAAAHDLDATPDAFEDVYSHVRRGVARVRVRRPVTGVGQWRCRPSASRNRRRKPSRRSGVPGCRYLERTHGARHVGSAPVGCRGRQVERSTGRLVDDPRRGEPVG
ncbi:glycosyltransferase [Umezawaea beigongshangensis]|uniref:glycosyltransferase n=1 Tax=Umezawaea beigongshangensis TaxID=2780383 RepID=UPI0027DCA953|nr:glycosyltransferase [Umezawaea beigongshangensis]